MSGSPTASREPAPADALRTVPAGPGGQESTPAGAPGGGPEGLGGRARSALLWSFVNNIVGRFGSSLVGIVLARILVPADYGVYAVALVGLNALLSMNELGISPAVVRWPGAVERIAPTVMTLAMGFSLVLWLACLPLAGTLCRAMNAPEATGVLRLLSLGVLIDAVTTVPAALMTREFRQKRRLVADTAGFLAVSVTSVGLALAGAGAWSLAWGMLVGNVVNGVLIVLWAPVRVRPGLRRETVAELLSFGMPLAAASLLLFAMQNIDYVVIGRLLGKEPLGLYMLAFNLSAWPVTIFSAPVRRVALPAFARLQGDARAAGAAFERALTLLVAVTAPACLLLALLSTPLIAVVYGQRWVPAAPALSLLVVLGLTRVLGELSYDFLVALGRSRPNLAIQALWCAALVAALPVGARLGGVEGVACAHAAVAVTVVLPAYGTILRREGVRPAAVLRAAARPGAGLCLCAGAVLVSCALVPGRPLQLVVGGACGVLAYAVVIFPLRHLVRAGLSAGKTVDPRSVETNDA